MAGGFVSSPSNNLAPKLDEDFLTDDDLVLIEAGTDRSELPTYYHKLLVYDIPLNGNDDELWAEGNDVWAKKDGGRVHRLDDGDFPVHGFDLFVVKDRNNLPQSKDDLNELCDWVAGTHKKGEHVNISDIAPDVMLVYISKEVN